MTLNATYSPEDNKLRLYPLSRLPKELYERVRAAGFIWAPKQELFVAPAWTPDRLVRRLAAVPPNDSRLGHILAALEGYVPWPLRATTKGFAPSTAG